MRRPKAATLTRHAARDFVLALALSLLLFAAAVATSERAWPAETNPAAAQQIAQLVSPRDLDAGARQVLPPSRPAAIEATAPAGDPTVLALVLAFAFALVSTMTLACLRHLRRTSAYARPETVRRT